MFKSSSKTSLGSGCEGDEWGELRTFNASSNETESDSSCMSLGGGCDGDKRGLVTFEASTGRMTRISLSDKDTGGTMIPFRSLLTSLFFLQNLCKWVGMVAETLASADQEIERASTNLRGLRKDLAI